MDYYVLLIQLAAVGKTAGRCLLIAPIQKLICISSLRCGAAAPHPGDFYFAGPTQAAAAHRRAGRDRAAKRAEALPPFPAGPPGTNGSASYPRRYTAVFCRILLKESGGARILEASLFTIHGKTMDILYFHAAIPPKLRRACRQTRHIPLFGTPIRQPANIEGRGRQRREHILPRPGAPDGGESHGEAGQFLWIAGTRTFCGETFFCRRKANRPARRDMMLSGNVEGRHDTYFQHIWLYPGQHPGAERGPPAHRAPGGRRPGAQHLPRQAVR